ncbi:MAG: DUF4139 domain-containing protein [Candidatus Omnitrophica bacterium]|nr:DUF4139 domain-containing protein [Candidatus Omnitrophota bacterium]
MVKRILAVVAVLSVTILSAQAEPLQSTIDGQKNVEITIYNSNLGLVKDVRDIDIPSGAGEVKFMDVAAHIMPETVHIKELGGDKGFSVLEQNYEYDLINNDKLLDKYVGKKVKLVDFNQYQDRKETVDAELLSNNNGQVYRINGEIYLGYPGYKILPEIPQNLIAKPTLTWLYENKTAGNKKLEVSYLTNGVGWKADYIMVINGDDTSSDISGWVTVNNTSGATFKDARMKLVAGDVNRVREPEVQYAVSMTLSAGYAGKAAQFEEKEFFEYHIYDLSRPTTIKDNQTKQVSLLEAGGVAIKKELIVAPNRPFFSKASEDYKEKVPVKVSIKFKNDKASLMGMPLPAGTIRLYKADKDGSLQFAGEDKIGHTPKDEEVTVKVGEAFDIAAEKAQLDFQQLSRNKFESEWETTIRNHKKEAVNIGVVETLPPTWQMISKSHEFTKLSADKIRFDLNVPADGEVKVKYRIQVGI